MSFANTKYLVLGATNSSLACVGAITALCQNEKLVLTDLQGIAGTSNNVFVAFAVVAGMCVNNVKKLLCSDIVWSHDKVFEELDLTSILNGSGGLCKHDALHNQVDFLFRLLDLPDTLTFLEFHEKTGKHFLCNATCIDGIDGVARTSNLPDIQDQDTPSTGTNYIMDYLKTPTMKIKDALIMCMSSQFVFQPFEYDQEGKWIKKCLFIDAHLTHRYLLDVFQDKDIDTVLGIYSEPKTSVSMYTGFMFNIGLAHRLLACQASEIHKYYMKTLSEKSLSRSILLYNGPEQTATTENDHEREFRLGISSVEWYLKKEEYLSTIVIKFLYDLLHNKNTRTIEE